MSLVISNKANAKTNPVKNQRLKKKKKLSEIAFCNFGNTKHTIISAKEYKEFSSYIQRGIKPE